MELPLALVLAEMENSGFAVDAAGIEAFGIQIEAQITEIQKNIFSAVGYEFNLTAQSSLQKHCLGFGTACKETKTGYSTNAEVRNLRNAIVAMLLEYRMLAKLKSLMRRAA